MSVGLVKAAMALPLALAIGLAAMAQTAVPDASPLPPGPGRDVVAAKCGSCHTLAIVAGQRRDRAAWEQSIEQMIGRGAEISDAEYEQIAAYLGSNLAP